MAGSGDQVVPYSASWFWGWFSWSPMSSTLLRTAEKKILSCLKTPYRGWYVDIGSVVGKSDKIWTISLNTESKKTPIVLLHGLGGGVAIWCLNLDALAATRPVYAIDLLGFGRSSRPTFSSNAEVAETQLVNSVEEWRQEMGLEKIILLGHSLGGFLATSYAIKHPDNVKHLILADPWGFPEKPKDPPKWNAPLWARAIASMVQPLNPLWAVRFAGPFGPWLIQKVRPDLSRKFAPILEDEDTSVVSSYIFQCNAQSPTGESAFHTMMDGFGWAKNPMIRRVDDLKESVPITLLYGSRSWVDKSPGEKIRENRSKDAYVDIQMVQGAGHHVYADKYELFNKYVIEACQKVDESDDS